MGCHLRHKFLLRFNTMCSLSPCRMMLYLPETCPSLLIMLADLVTLVIQINVFGFLFFCFMGLWSIILINLWIIKMSYKIPLPQRHPQPPPVMIVCLPCALSGNVVPENESMETTDISGRASGNLISYLRSHLAGEILCQCTRSKYRLFSRRNANKAAATQKHWVSPVCTPEPCFSGYDATDIYQSGKEN